MLWIISIVNICYAPLLIYLKDPPAQGEKMVRLFRSENKVIVCLRYSKERLKCIVLINYILQLLNVNSTM